MTALVVAITGGIAAGKSEVSRRFEQLGVTIVDADLAARTVVDRGAPALLEITERFGTKMLQADGSLNRQRMREHIFADPAERRVLEAITHPRIRALLKAQCDAASGAYAIAVIPLLAETGVRQTYDWLWRVLVVDTPLTIQRFRLIARDGISIELANEMICAQASREQRLALAGDVIINDAAPDVLDHPVRRLDAYYRALATR